MDTENKKLWWVVIVVIVLIAIAFWVYYYSAPYEVPSGAGVTLPPPDSAAVIEADLKALDISGLDSELTDIDKELAQ